jgi:hypothetical protein
MIAEDWNMDRETERHIFNNKYGTETSVNDSDRRVGVGKTAGFFYILAKFGETVMCFWKF